MATRSDRDWIKHYTLQLTAASKAHEDWMKRYETDLLEKYWQGHQWADQKESVHQRSYVINQFWTFIEGKLPTIMFQRPAIAVEGRPSRKDDPASLVEARAQLIEDTVNTFLDDENLHFVEETEDPLREHFWAFGVVEVGYSADWAENPNARKPVMKGDGQEMKTSTGETVRQPDFYVKNQKLFINQIPYRRFRVPVVSSKILERNDWLAYYDWVHPAALAADRSLDRNAVAKVKPTAQMRTDILPDIHNEEETMRSQGLVKRWKLWDKKRAKRVQWIDGNQELLRTDSFKYYPFATIKGPSSEGTFYPVPPAFNWIHPQNEINDIREKTRIYRQRSEPKFGRTDGVDEEEWRKIEDGGAYACAVLPSQDSIWEIPMSDKSFQLERMAPQSKLDFQEIAAFSGDDTGIRETETATQGLLLNQRSQVRESAERQRVARWLVQIMKLMVFTAIDKMPLSLWVKTNVNVDTLAVAQRKALAGDPAGAEEILQQAQAAQEVASTWQEIKAMDLADFKFDIKVQVESLSPIASQEDFRAFMAFIATIQANPIFLFNDDLLRELGRNLNIRGDRKIMGVKQAILASLQAQAAAQNQSGTNGQGSQPGAASVGSTPSNVNQITDQLFSQVGAGVRGGFQ